VSKNTKQTSKGVASLAAVTLQNKNASKISKSLAGSALGQRSAGKQTGVKMETVASKAIQSNKTSTTTKTLAATVLAQSNKKR